MKKTILLVVLLIPIFCSAQNDSDCLNKYIKIEYDKISDKTTIAGKKIIELKNTSNVTVSIDAIIAGSLSKAIVLDFHINKDIICTDKDDFINVLFSDNTRCIMPNTRDFSCDGTYFTFMGGMLGNETLIEMLSTKKIEAMRFNARNKIQDFEFSKEDADIFYNQFNCLNNKLKSL